MNIEPLNNNQVDYHERCFISSDGTKFYLMVPECGECANQYCTDIFGSKITCPDLTTSTECERDVKLQCKKSSTLYTVIDNAGSRFNWNMLIELTLTDDSIVTVNHLPQSNWNNSLLHLVDLFTEALQTKCSQFTAEVRFNPRPFTLTDFTGQTAPNGLLFPPSEIAGSIPNMGWRYVQINACPTCVSIKRARIINVNGNEFNRDLPLSFVSGIEKRYDLCQDCAEEGTLYYQGTNEVVLDADKPPCLFDCSENIPSPPEAGCNFTIIEGCDNLPDGTQQEIFIQYADCGTGELVNAIYVLDTDGGLVDYEVQGTIDDCNGNNIEPPPIVTPFYTTPVCITINGEQQNGLLINDDGKEIFVTNNGAVKPDAYDIGHCKEECKTSCSDSVSGYDITEALGSCTKIGFSSNTVFTSICTDNWTVQDLVDVLNDNNPTGTIFEVLEGNVIGIVSGEPPEAIYFFNAGITVFPTTSEDDNCAYQVKDCNSDRNIELLQEIADNTCPSTSTSNVICSSIEQTVRLENGTTETLSAGQELIIGQILDCKGNIQSFSISTLVNSELIEITNAIQTGECPEENNPVPIGCIKDANGQKFNVFEVILNAVKTTYYQDEITGVVGTPAGDSESWTSCTEECGSFTGIIKCYSTEDQTLDFNSTEGTIAIRTFVVNGINTIDWSTQTQNAAEQSTIDFINSCLNSGTNPSISLTTDTGNTYNFNLFSIVVDGNTSNPNYEVSTNLTIPPIQTIETLTITCSNGGSGKASQWKSCDLQETKWFGCNGNELTVEEINSLEDCNKEISYTSIPVCLNVEGNKINAIQVLEISNINGVVSSRIFYLDLLGNEVTGNIVGGCEIPARTVCSSVFGNITSITVNGITTYYGANGLEITDPVGTITLGECNNETPVVVENCALVNNGLETIQYGIYPSTGIHVGWYTIASTQEIITTEPQWVDCCDSITEICI